MFDREKQFQVRIRSGGVKTCVLSWPTDEQWCERTRKQRIVRRLASGSFGEPEWPDREKVNAELFAAIRVDKDGLPFDEYEAVEALARLEAAEVADVVPIGDNAWEIRLVVNKSDETIHRLKEPTAKQGRKFEERRISPPVRRGRESVTRACLEPAGELYDACLVEFKGYAQGQQPPIVHKVKAIFALFEALEDDEPDPE